MINALFSGAAAAGMWVALYYGMLMDKPWCTSIAILWGALVYLGIEYGGNNS